MKKLVFRKNLPYGIANFEFMFDEQKEWISKHSDHGSLYFEVLKQD